MIRGSALLVAVLVLGGCGSSGDDEPDAFWSMSGCPTVAAGAYSKSIRFTGTNCTGNAAQGNVWTESVFIDDKGLLETTDGCSFTRSTKSPASCSAAIELTCPVRQYVGNVKVMAANHLVFTGTMTIGDGCPAQVSIDFRLQ